MLSGYPASALNHNWFHRVMCAIVGRVHADVRSGRRAATPWQNLIPNRHRDEVVGKEKLKRLVHAYRRAFVRLTPAERDVVIDALAAQNRLDSLLGGASDCRQLAELPVGIREAAKELFVCGFELLTALGTRDLHYKAIYESLRDKVCPFCGIDRFESPTRPKTDQYPVIPREDYDHYLPKSKYPFAAVNLRNLVPACNKCNTGYKKTANPLFDHAGGRRRALNPYQHRGFSISLNNSSPAGGSAPYIPKWRVDFDPAGPEAETWDSMFHLRFRWENHILNVDYMSWVDDFAAYCYPKHVVSTTAELAEALKHYVDYLTNPGAGALSFLRAAVGRMQQAFVAAGEEDVIFVLKDTAQRFREVREKLLEIEGSR